MPATSFDFPAAARECRVPDLPTLIQKGRKLYELLAEANRRVNLTRIDTPDGYWLKHVLDSLLIGYFFPEIATRPFSLADIGCGAGFPSLVLAIAFPQLQITAIDSIGKKTAFVRQAVTELALSNVTVINRRSREMNCQSAWQNRFDIVTGRAVAESVKLFQEARRLVRPDGRFILYKTPEQAAADLPLLNALKPDRQSRPLHWQATAPREWPGNAGTRLFLYSD